MLQSFHMTATAILCYNPSNKFLRINRPKQRYLTNNSSSPRLHVSRSFTCGIVPFKLWVKSEMDGFVRSSSPRLSDSRIESTLNRLSKWIVSSLFGVFVLWRRDPEALWLAGGSVVNAVLCFSLKQMLNQKRPSTLKSDPGMPSSHSQSIFFAIIFIILSNVELLRINAITLTSSGMALAFGSYLSYLRVSQKLHTVSQVVVGAVVGSIFSILWYWLWNAFVLDAFASSLWVRIIVILGFVGYILCFLQHVVRHWLKEE